MLSSFRSVARIILICGRSKRCIWQSALLISRCDIHSMKSSRQESLPKKKHRLPSFTLPPIMEVEHGPIVEEINVVGTHSPHRRKSKWWLPMYRLCRRRRKFVYFGLWVAFHLLQHFCDNWWLLAPWQTFQVGSDCLNDGYGEIHPMVFLCFFYHHQINKSNVKHWVILCSFGDSIRTKRLRLK